MCWWRHNFSSEIVIYSLTNLLDECGTAVIVKGSIIFKPVFTMTEDPPNPTYTSFKVILRILLNYIHLFYKSFQNPASESSCYKTFPASPYDPPPSVYTFDLYINLFKLPLNPPKLHIIYSINLLKIPSQNHLAIQSVSPKDPPSLPVYTFYL